MNNTEKGFSLIEIMVVVLIISILTAIAWPAYQSHVTRTNRAAAAVCVEQSAQFMERFHTLNMRYDQDRDGAAVALPQSGCEEGLRDNYELTIAAVDTNTYTITATPTGVQATQDNECGALSVDQSGLRTVTGQKPARKCR